MKPGDIGFADGPVMRCPCGWRMPQIAVGARTEREAAVAQTLDVAMQCPECKRVHVSILLIGAPEGPPN